MVWLQRVRRMAGSPQQRWELCVSKCVEMQVRWDRNNFSALGWSSHLSGRNSRQMDGNTYIRTYTTAAVKVTKHKLAPQSIKWVVNNPWRESFPKLHEIRLAAYERGNSAPTSCVKPWETAPMFLTPAFGTKGLRSEVCMLVRGENREPKVHA